jgi:hypothetical protein
MATCRYPLDGKAKFEDGDFITVYDHADIEWWHGHVHRTRADVLFHSSCVKIHERSDTTPHVKALWDYVPQEHDELLFYKGDLIEVLDHSHENWWLGRLRGYRGIFPLNHVQLLLDSLQEDLKNSLPIGHPGLSNDGPPSRIAVEKYFDNGESAPRRTPSPGPATHTTPDKGHGFRAGLREWLSK